MKKRKLVHVWEMCEIILHSSTEFENPYVDVDVWLDLVGPDFKKRVYGFWNGKNEFCIRIVATQKGLWRWHSHSNYKNDKGLNDITGDFEAQDWTEKEKEENPNRRGFFKVTQNKHGISYADGTPHYIIADTWWAGSTYRQPWVDDKNPLPKGIKMSFQEMVNYRKQQHYNTIAMIAAFPNWSNDGYPSTAFMNNEEKTPIRDTWQPDIGPAQTYNENSNSLDMYNEGGRAFNFPGKVPNYENIVPDYDRINPEYFKYLDKRIQYLSDKGFASFIEICRRDISIIWKKYYKWPDSYARYIHYVFARYQAYNTLLSPIHYDWDDFAIDSREFNAPANINNEKYGMPFGNLSGTDPNASSLQNYGNSDESKWLTFHSVGNLRPHRSYWYLTEIFNNKEVKPAMNTEPFYPGFPDDNPRTDSKDAERNCRSGMYGSFLSGGLMGYFYGCQGLWGGLIDDKSPYATWKAIKFKSGNESQFLLKFVKSVGNKFQELIPNNEMILGSRTADYDGYTEWAYLAHTEKKDMIMLYFEENNKSTEIRSLLHDQEYVLKYYNPRNGEWLKEEKIVKVDPKGMAKLPERPTYEDWGACLEIK